MVVQTPASIGDKARMDEIRLRSQQVRMAHTKARQLLRSGDITFDGLLAQAAFDPDLSGMLVRRALSAIKTMNATKAEQVLVAARVPLNGRIAWLLAHPKSASRVSEQLKLATRPRIGARKPPNPCWPWRD